MKKGLKAVYLDICSLCRPFDDQSFLRIRLETEAVNLILTSIREQYYKMLVSPVHYMEMEAIGDRVERIELQTMLSVLGTPIHVDILKAKTRANELVKLKFGIADAAHVAFAEQSGAFFISSDDSLVKRCIKHRINIWCGNPVIFCEEERLK